MSDLAVVEPVPRNPTKLVYPATLPIEVAMRTGTAREICQAYGLSRSDWLALLADPLFLDDVKRASENLSQEGMSFKMKARLQAEELLNTSWQIIHNPVTPAPVRADLIKSVVKWGGLDAEVKDKSAAGPGMHIQINFGSHGR